MIKAWIFNDLLKKEVWKGYATYLSRSMYLSLSTQDHHALVSKIDRMAEVKSISLTMEVGQRSPDKERTPDRESDDYHPTCYLSLLARAITNARIGRREPTILTLWSAMLPVTF